MNIKKRVVIISAELKGLSEVENNRRTAKLATELRLHQLKFKRALGSYKDTTETSFIVDASEDITRKLAVLAETFEQESILIVQDDAARNADLFFVFTGKTERIGQISHLTSIEASKEDNWTLDLENNLYFGVK